MNHKTAKEYLDRTETAVEKLFDGIAQYVKLIRPQAFVAGVLPGDDFDRKFAAWELENRDTILQSRADMKSFWEQEFALGVLCGAVLHVADKAIELYGANDEVSDDWKEFCRSGQAKYCVGREVRGVPLGLVILAGRNQHAHHGERPRTKLGIETFRRLSQLEGGIDPAFDINNQRVVSFAANITALLKWRTLAKYNEDMHSLLVDQCQG